MDSGYRSVPPPALQRVFGAGWAKRRARSTALAPRHAAGLLLCAMLVAATSAAAAPVITGKPFVTLLPEPAAISENGGRSTVTARLSSPLAQPFAVTVSAAAVAPAVALDFVLSASTTLSFAAGATESSGEVTVTAVDNALDAPARAVTVSGSVSTPAVRAPADVTLTVEDDEAVPAVRVLGARAVEGEAAVFTVLLAEPSGRPVMVDWGTTEGTGTAKPTLDYAPAFASLTIAAGRTAGTFAVTTIEDTLDEGEETFTVLAQRRQHADEAVAPVPVSVTGTIVDEDDDERPGRVTGLTAAADGASVIALSWSSPAHKGTGGLRGYRVEVSADGGASWSDLVTDSGDTATEYPHHQALAGQTRHYRVRAIGAGGEQGPPSAVARVTSPPGEPGNGIRSIETLPGQPPSPSETAVAGALRLSSLEVTGGGTMYPPFESDVLHYAVTCNDPEQAPTQLHVKAKALDPGSSIRLNGNLVEGPSLDETVAAISDHDIAIELSGDHGVATYVVHCIPRDFPAISIEKKEAGVSDGLLFVTPSYGRRGERTVYLAILDNNGVPRFHRKTSGARNFRRHAHGPYRYSVTRRIENTSEIALLNERFEELRVVGTVAPLTHTDGHDFLITEEGNFLFISYNPAIRDFSEYRDPFGDRYSSAEEVEDSVIQEVSPDGQEVYVWNSFDHLDLGHCIQVGRFPGDYAHVNSLQLIDGDIVASFRGCGQVLRIDRSDKSAIVTGTSVVWQLGGAAPTRDPNTAFLGIEGDPAGAFCGQHHVTETRSGTIVLFDNGSPCQGDRALLPPFSRVVEYEIAADRSAALFVRQFRLPDQYGYTRFGGGVTVLDNGHWLIAWRNLANVDPSLSIEKRIAVSEVDTSGIEVFRVSMYFQPDPSNADISDSQPANTYRVYRERETDVDIPLNLPQERRGRDIRAILPCRSGRSPAWS